MTSEIRPAVCTIAFAKRGLEDALKGIADAGYHEIDLLGRMPHFSVDEQEYDVAELERLCKKYDLRIVNLATYFGQALNDSSDAATVAAELARARRGIEIAVRLGARSMRVQPGKDRTHETAFALVPFLQEVARVAEAHGVYLGVETHGGITSDAAGMVELCERVGSRHFGVLYDPCNLMAGGVDYKQAYDVMRSHIVYVHIKDGREQDGRRERVMLGDGEISVPWLLDILARDGYQGAIALEYEVAAIEPPETGLVEWRRRWEALTR